MKRSQLITIWLSAVFVIAGFVFMLVSVESNRTASSQIEDVMIDAENNTFSVYQKNGDLTVYRASGSISFDHKDNVRGLFDNAPSGAPNR